MEKLHRFWVSQIAQKIIYATAKETREWVTFKLFEYLIYSIPEF